MSCQAFVYYQDKFALACDLAEGHEGSHHDPDRLLDWGPAARTISLAADDPPEYGPDDAEAQRIAETCADANREHDRIENEDRP